jgi:hypothetical protein
MEKAGEGPDSFKVVVLLIAQCSSSLRLLFSSNPFCCSTFLTYSLTHSLTHSFLSNSLSRFVHGTMSDQTLAPSQPPPLPPSDHLQPFPIIPILTTGTNNNSSTSTSDNTSSGNTSDNTSPSVLPNPHDSIMSRAFYWLRSFYIPTSPSQLQLTQKKMFEKFVRQPVEHKLFMLKSGDYLNYIDMKGSSSTIPAAARNHPGSIADTSENKKKKPTLILMHGYGSGLGMFFGE